MSIRIVVPLVLALSVPGLSRASADDVAGAVYAMTNAADANAIVVYDRDSAGHLSLRGYVSTDGQGSGGEPPLEAVDALGSQSALLLSHDARWLFAANAGSAEISAFSVDADGLTLVDKQDSGGLFPTSLALHGNLLYVLNAGGEASIRGYRLQNDGSLTPLADSVRELQVGGSNPPRFLVSPAQIGFDPRGEHLLITIKGSNELRVYSLDQDGRPSATATVSQSAGTAPFGFGFDDHQHLIVAEPFGRSTPGTGGAGAVSSYDILADGSLERLSVSVQNWQTATCWLQVSPDGRFAYTTNNASSTISGYRVSADGSLSLLAASGVLSATGANPVDLAMSRDGRFLFTVNAGAGTISTFQVDKANGALTALGDVSGLPNAGAAGLAAR